MNENILYIYIATAVVILLICLLVFQFGRDVIVKDKNISKKLTLDTPDGVVFVDKTQFLNEVEKIQKNFTTFNMRLDADTLQQILLVNNEIDKFIHKQVEKNKTEYIYSTVYKILNEDDELNNTNNGLSHIGTDEELVEVRQLDSGMILNLLNKKMNLLIKLVQITDACGLLNMNKIYKLLSTLNETYYNNIETTSPDYTDDIKNIIPANNDSITVNKNRMVGIHKMDDTAGDMIYAKFDDSSDCSRRHISNGLNLDPSCSNGNSSLIQSANLYKSDRNANIDATYDMADKYYTDDNLLSLNI